MMPCTSGSRIMAPNPFGSYPKLINRSSNSRIASWLIAAGISSSNRSSPSATKLAICTDVSRYLLSTITDPLQLLENILPPKIRGTELHPRVSGKLLRELNDPPAVLHRLKDGAIGRRVAVARGVRLLAGCVVDRPGANAAVQVRRLGIEDQELL